MRKGPCVPTLPQITGILNTGSGKDGSFQSGDTIKVAGKNALFPVPTATKLVLKGDDGSLYVLENPRLPDDWYTHHYDNDNLVLYFTVPDDLTTAKISGGTDKTGTTQFGAGLVVAGSGALATTAVSDGALAALFSNPVSAIATIGATATGLSIYAGIDNSIWLIKKVTMALEKVNPSPTSLDKPGQSADNQTRDPQREIFFTYELGKPSDSRNRFVYASTMEIPYYLTSSAEEQVRGRVALLEGLSPLQVSVLGEEYWEYSNAVVMRVLDLGSVGHTPSTIPVSFYVCVSNGWNMSPLGSVHTDSTTSGTLSWKINAYFGWDPPQPLTADDFFCFAESKQISLSMLLTAY